MAAIQRMSGQTPAGVYNEPPAATVAERVRRFFRRERS
jgi:1-acyl-sn-glycerol-3-phosphate acyltransferase